MGAPSEAHAAKNARRKSILQIVADIVLGTALGVLAAPFAVDFYAHVHGGLHDEDLGIILLIAVGCALLGGFAGAFLGRLHAWAGRASKPIGVLAYCALAVVLLSTVGVWLYRGILRGEPQEANYPYLPSKQSRR